MKDVIVQTTGPSRGKSLIRIVRRPITSICLKVFLGFVGFAGFGPADSAADTERLDIEHLVFEDCGMARMMIGHLPADDLEKNLITLVGTLRLGIRGSGYGATGPGQLAGGGSSRIPGHGELRGDIVLMSLDPGRNERARRCSIDLLRSFLPVRPLVMRELIALADDPDIVGGDRALAEEIRGMVVAVAQEVAPELSRSDVVLLIEPLVREQPGKVVANWKSLLRVFLFDALNLISRKYLNDPEFDESLLEIVTALDPSGEVSLESMKEAFLTFDDEMRRARVLTWMQRIRLPLESALSLLLPELVFGSGKNTGEVLRTIAVSVGELDCSAQPQLSGLSSSFVVEAVSSWGVVMQESIRTGEPGVRCIPQCRDTSGKTGLGSLWCDRRQLDHYRRFIEELMTSDSPLLGMSWPAIGTLPLENGELEGYLRRSLNSVHRSVRVAAFSIYSEQPMDRGKFVSDALRLLKRPAVVGDEKRAILERLASSFVSPPIGIRGLPALPLFLDSFDLTLAECGLLCSEHARRKPLVVRAIGAIGKDAFPLLVRSLESTHKQRRRLALLSLGELSPVDERMAYFLVGGLRDAEGELRELSQQLLAQRRGEVAVRRELTKALKWSDTDAAGRAAALLIE